MLLNFTSGARAIPTDSLADFPPCAEGKRSDFFCAQFAGKVVFIGAVLDVEDRKITSKRLVTGPDGERRGERCVLLVMDGQYRASFARDSIPSVYVHATAVNNLILGDALHDLGKSTAAPVAMALALAAAVATFGVLLGYRFAIADKDKWYLHGTFGCFSRREWLIDWSILASRLNSAAKSESSARFVPTSPATPRFPNP